jgi:hypothetical protein
MLINGRPGRMKVYFTLTAKVHCLKSKQLNPAAFLLNLREAPEDP